MPRKKRTDSEAPQASETPKKRTRKSPASGKRASVKAPSEGPERRANPADVKKAAGGAGAKKTPARKPATARASRAKAAAADGPAPGTPEFQQEVARMAYHLWEARGRPHGSSDEDWVRAEAQLLEKVNARQPKA